MTLYLVDIASHQDAKPAIGQKELDLSVAKKAGFSLVNIKTSQGNWYSYSKAGVWAARARDLGMGISTFHWLDNTASGSAQATIAYNAMRDMGGPDAMAHQCDCEDNASQAIWRDYVSAMQDKLGRPIANYTGDWWWTARGWSGAGLTPYLWAAPNNGYLSSYPGDASPAWTAGYGGWSSYSLLQYSVSGISGAGGGNLSKTAIRDPAVWAALTGDDDMALTDDDLNRIADRVFTRGGTSTRSDGTKVSLDTWQGIVAGGVAKLLAATGAEVQRDAAQDSTLAALPQAVADRLGAGTLSAQEAADLLRPLLGDKAAQVGTLLAQA